MGQLLDFKLADSDEERKDGNLVKGIIEITPTKLWIHIDGYGECTASEGEGFPIGIEIYNGRLRLLVWPDINDEESEVIDMEGAREFLWVKGE